jgi:hypothetical protein
MDHSVSELKRVVLDITDITMSSESLHFIIGGFNQDGAYESMVMHDDDFYEYEPVVGGKITYDRPYHNLSWELKADAGVDYKALEDHLKKLMEENYGTNHTQSD